MLTQLLQQIAGEWSNLLIQAGISLQPPLSAIQVSGGPTEDRKVNFLVFDQAANQPVLILKVGRTAAYQAQLKREYQALSQIWDLVPLRPTLPQPVGLVTFERHPVMIERGLPGTALSNLLYRREHLSKPAVHRDFEQIVGWLGTFHASTVSEVIEFSGRMSIQSRLQAHPDLATRLPATLIQQLMEMADEVEGFPIQRVGQHGDFWPGNILITEQGLGIIDWEDYQSGQLPFHDLFQFMILYAQIYPWRGWQNIDQATTFQNAILTPTWYARMIRKYTQAILESYGIPAQFAHLFFSLYLIEQATPTPEQGIKRQQQASRWQNRLFWYADHYRESIFLNKGLS